MREKIQQAAKELEYRPNPFVSAFTAQVRGYRRSPQHASIAILNTLHPGMVRESDKRYTEGAVNRAEKLGFRTEVFSFNELDRKPARFLHILYSRGIRGLLILPLPANEDLHDLNLDHLATASIDLSDHLPAVSRTVPDYFRHMQTTLNKLQSYGYKRIGFCTTPTELVGFGRYSLASYLLWQRQIPASKRIIEHVNESKGRDGGRGDFLQWLKKQTRRSRFQ
jgi:LacI family transcriptional regulator